MKTLKDPKEDGIQVLCKSNKSQDIENEGIDKSLDVLFGPKHYKLLPSTLQVESTKKLKKYCFNIKRKAREKLQTLDKDFEEFMNTQLSCSTSNGQIDRDDKDYTLELRRKDGKDANIVVLPKNKINWTIRPHLCNQRD